MRINTEILNLSDLFIHLKHFDVITLLTELREIKIELEGEIQGVEDVPMELADKLELQSILEVQMDCLKTNIKTVEVALLCHEAKTFEKKKILGKLCHICLN